jgi:hypothetical protein
MDIGGEASRISAQDGGKEMDNVVTRGAVAKLGHLSSRLLREGLRVGQDVYGHVNQERRQLLKEGGIVEGAVGHADCSVGVQADNTADGGHDLAVGRIDLEAFHDGVFSFLAENYRGILGGDGDDNGVYILA